MSPDALPARLSFRDHGADPASWAASLGVSVAACELLVDADFVDLHCDLEVPVRLFGYRAERPHPGGARTRPLVGHTDYPRLREASLTGVVADIATNPLRSQAGRLAATERNVAAIRARVAAWPEDLEIVTDRASYDRARAAGRMAVWIALQGGNALSANLSVLQGELGRVLHRITLVHLTSSDLGGTSSPWGIDRGITAKGRELVARCNEARVLVDLAHAGRATFFGALEVHAADLPPIVSHTGVAGVRRHWRNLDDDQIRAIADRGGVVGVLYHSLFLAPVLLTCSRSAILDHLEHVIRIGGEEVAAIGTDYDGMIVPPRDLRDVTHQPQLVQDMIDRGWPEVRIRRVLGLNALRVVGAARPGV
jgi:membrane dipeptidase